MKILVVDDSKTIRMIIGRTLTALGYQVAEAGNGKEALNAVRADGEIRLALVDWNMPEMNGLEFVQAVRADDAIKALPIMMVTTESEMGNVKKALEAGANEFVMKPFTKEVIQEKIAVMGVF